MEQDRTEREKKLGDLETCPGMDSFLGPFRERLKLAEILKGRLCSMTVRRNAEGHAVV